MDKKTAKTPPKPRAGETLQNYLDRCEVEFFTSREVLTLRRLGVTVKPPPRAMWANIIPTLFLADYLRTQMGGPLAIGNGYRPEPYNSKVGGAPKSTHLKFRALDIDLAGKMAKDRNAQEEFYELAATLFLELGDEFKIGLGLYRPWRGKRVHLDTGFRKRHWKKEFSTPLLESLK